MTDSRSAEPRTEAGRQFEHDYRGYGFLDRILAIEAEASAAVRPAREPMSKSERPSEPTPSLQASAAPETGPWNAGYNHGYADGLRMGRASAAPPVFCPHCGWGLDPSKAQPISAAPTGPSSPASNLRFTVPGIPPSLNARLDRFGRAKSNALFRQDAKYAATDAKNRAEWVSAPRVKLALTFVFGVSRRHDLDNLIGSVKPIIDGVVDARIVADDSTDHVVSISASARVRTIDDPPGEFVVVDVEAV